MQFYSDRRPEWADLNHTLSPDQYASVSFPYSLFLPPPWCMNLIVKFSFIAKSAKADFVHLTHCQWAAFICKWRDNACTLRTFTVIFGNITKLVGMNSLCFHVFKKIESIFTLFLFLRFKICCGDFIHYVIYHIELEKFCARQGIANSVGERFPLVKANKWGFTIMRGWFSLVPSHQLKPWKPT